MHKSFIKRSTVIVMTLVYMANSFIFPLPSDASSSSPKTYGREYGWIDKFYEVKESEESRVTGIDLADNMYLTLADVRVTGAMRYSGKVNNYSKSTSHVDNGNPIVDIDEAREWAQIFNGNPSYLRNENGFYGYEITGGGPYAQKYTGYNLAKVAEMSGGGGGPFNFRPTTSGEKGNYVGVTSFVTTQRPDGQISTNKTQYNVGETVTINASGKDYSIYNRGLKVINMYIYNVNTGESEYRFDDVVRTWAISGSAPTDGSGSGAQINFPTKTWVPTKAGNYEARILITDTHDRNTKNAPSVGGQGVAYAAPFTVGDPSPPGGGDGGGGTDPDPDPGPSCTIANTKMDFQIVGRDDVKDYNAVASGGSSIMVEQNADITLFATKNGTFKMNGVEMEPGSGNNRKRGIGYFGDSGNFRVVFESDDGKDCWEKLFIVKSDSKEESCPIITISGTTYRNGDTVEVLPERTVYFQANFRNSSGDTESAYLLWDVTQPDGKTVTLPAYHEEVGGRNKIVETPYYKLELPFNGAHKVTLERGKEYKIKLNFKGTNWRDRPECAWEITLVVKDTACSISEQNKLKTKIYGSPPQPFSPSGEEINGYVGDPIYFRNFSSNPDGSFDTNLSFSVNAPGTWYLVNGSKRTLLTKVSSANERIDLILPNDYDIGDWVNLEFESDIGCIVTIKFEIMSDRRCYNIAVAMIRYGTFDDYLWKKEVSRGETLHLSPEDFDSKYRPQFLTPGEKTQFMMSWLDPDTQQWTWKRNGKFLSSSNSYSSSHYFQFPQDPDSDAILDGLYKIQFWTDNGWMGDYPNLECEGTIFLQVGESQVENLLIVKNSFTITPKDPQLPGTEATITFQVKNAGKTAHDTKLAVRWESSEKETVLDVNQFKPGETRKITVPTIYPQQSENFIANINPSKNKPENESIWTDNRALWPVKVTGSTNPPGGGGGDFESPGGEIPGGQLKIRVYDSGDRLLNLPNDGVWEKERARIEVEIDQGKINEALGLINEKINNAINAKKDELESRYSDYEDVTVSVSPTYWNAAGNAMTTWPPSTKMTVKGPGINAEYSLNTKLQLQSNNYTGTTVPTKKDGQDLVSTKYVVAADGFQIIANYKVDFSVTYEACEEDEEGDEKCTSGSDSDQIANTFTITIKGDQVQFEVFDLYVIGKVRHTEEWNKNRQAYNKAKTGDPEKPRYYDMYWAGETFVLHADTPDTGQSPVKLSSIQVTMSTTNLTTPLTLTNSFTGDGSLWRSNFQYLKDGPYTFTFVATWNHGHVETDTHTIVISDDWTKFFQLHRLY